MQPEAHLLIVFSVLIALFSTSIAGYFIPLRDVMTPESYLWSPTTFYNRPCCANLGYYNYPQEWGQVYPIYVYNPEYFYGWKHIYPTQNYYINCYPFGQNPTVFSFNIISNQKCCCCYDVNQSIPPTSSPETNYTIISKSGTSVKIDDGDLKSSESGEKQTQLQAETTTISTTTSLSVSERPANESDSTTIFIPPTYSITSSPEMNYTRIPKSDTSVKIDDVELKSEEKQTSQVQAETTTISTKPVNVTDLTTSDDTKATTEMTEAINERTESYSSDSYESTEFSTKAGIEEDESTIKEEDGEFSTMPEISDKVTIPTEEEVKTTIPNTSQTPISTTIRRGDINVDEYDYDTSANYEDNSENYIQENKETEDGDDFHFDLDTTLPPKDSFLEEEEEEEEDRVMEFRGSGNGSGDDE